MGWLSNLFGGSSSTPEELGDVYMDAKQAGDNESMYEIENAMYEDHGLVFDGGMWQPCDHEETGDNWFTRMFG